MHTLIDATNPDLVVETYVEFDSEEFCVICGVCEAKWDYAYVQSLPDSSFAYVATQNGKKVRKFPYKDADGNVDKAHVRNGLARLSNATLSDTEKAAVKAKLSAAAKKVGITVADDSKESLAVESGVIREMFVGRVTVLESETRPGVLGRIRAKVQEGNAVNRNGRLYPTEILKREVERMNQEIASRPGAVDHPDGMSPSVRDLGLKWERVWLEGNEFFAEGDVIDTAAGRDLNALVRAGVEIGISSRGFGSAKVETRNGERVSVIQEDFELVTFDAVSDPSVYSARINKIESIDFASLMANESNQMVLRQIVKEMTMESNDVMAQKVAGLLGLKTETVTILATQPDPTDETQNPAGGTFDGVGDPTDDAEQTIMAVSREGVEGNDMTPTLTDVPQPTATQMTNPVIDPAVPNKSETPPSVVPGLSTATGDKTSPMGDLTTPTDDQDDTLLGDRADHVPADQELTIMAVRAESAEHKLAKLEQKASERTAPLAAALAAIAELISQELAEPDFYDVSMLADLASRLKSWNSWEDFSDDEDDEDDGASESLTHLVATIKTLVAHENAKSLQAYIETVAAGEKLSATLAAHLKQFCHSKAEVDAKLAESKALIASMNEDTVLPGGRGTIADPQPSKPLSENDTLAHKAGLYRAS